MLIETRRDAHWNLRSKHFASRSSSDICNCSCHKNTVFDNHRVGEAKKCKLIGLVSSSLDLINVIVISWENNLKTFSNVTPHAKIFVVKTLFVQNLHTKRDASLFFACLNRRFIILWCLSIYTTRESDCYVWQSTETKIFHFNIYETDILLSRFRNLHKNFP